MRVSQNFKREVVAHTSFFLFSQCLYYKPTEKRLRARQHDTAAIHLYPRLELVLEALDEYRGLDVVTHANRICRPDIQETKI